MISEMLWLLYHLKKRFSSGALWAPKPVYTKILAPARKRSNVGLPALYIPSCSGLSFLAVRESVLTQYVVILVLTFINDFTDKGLPIRTRGMREEKNVIPSRRV
jgi:hypothetical protein